MPPASLSLTSQLSTIDISSTAPSSQSTPSLQLTPSGTEDAISSQSLNLKLTSSPTQNSSKQSASNESLNLKLTSSTSQQSLLSNTTADLPPKTQRIKCQKRKNHSTPSCTLKKATPANIYYHYSQEEGSQLPTINDENSDSDMDKSFDSNISTEPCPLIIDTESCSTQNTDEIFIPPKKPVIHPTVSGKGRYGLRSSRSSSTSDIPSLSLSTYSQ